MFVRLAVMLLMLAQPAAALSNAATFLIDGMVAEGCPEGGTMDRSAVIERDLDGDGRDDLILSQERLACSGGGPSISLFCGMQVCTTPISLRRGDLLEQEVETLNSVVSVGSGNRPAIMLRSHGGAFRAIRWTGRAFE